MRTTRKNNAKRSSEAGKKSPHTANDVEKKYQALFEQSPYGILLIDTEGKILDFNETAHRDLGYTREEFANITIADIDPVESIVDVKARISRILEEGRAEFEVRHRTKQGELRDVHVITKVLTLSGQTLLHSMWRDITERKRAENEVELFRNLLNKSSEAIFVNDPQTGCFINMNDRACASLGYDREELLKMGVMDVETAFRDNFSWQGHVNEVRQKGSLLLEGVLRRKDATTFPVETNVSFVSLDSGEYMIAVVHDITERKRAEEKLLESRAMLRQILDTLPQSIFWKDRDSVYLNCNAAFARAVGLEDPDQIMGKTDFDLPWPKEDAEAYRADDRDVLTNNLAKRHIIEPLQQSDGARLWIDTTKVPLVDHHGNAYGVLGVYEDITERKDAEERLRKSEGRLRESQRVARLGSWDLDFVSRKLEWSDETYKLFDKTPEDFVPSFDAFARLVHPDDRETMQTNFNNALQSDDTPYHVSVRIINDSGREWVMEAFGAVRRDEDGSPISIFGTAHDITERKRWEEALLISEERLRQSVSVSNLGIFDHNHLAETIYWSARQREIYGWGPDETVTLGAFIDCIYPEDREKITAEVRRAHDPAGDGLYDVEHRIIRRDGSVRWVVTRSQTFFSGEGGVRRAVRTIGAVSDITERKRAEERIGQSLREKETLLRELYHRTKNNMQVITSLLNLQSHTTYDKKALQVIGDTKNRIFSMALVHEKLYKAKDLSRVNLKDYIPDLIASLMDSYQISKGKISLLLDIDDIAVSIDTITPCGLVINELMTNTLKYAFPDNRAGKITVSAHLNAEGIIELRFSDDGIGLPEGVDLNKPESLGLKIVHILVETQLRGKIAIEGAHGAGFVIRFKEMDKRTRT